MPISMDADLITKTEHEAIVAERDDEIARLKFTIEKFKKLLLGPRSEKPAFNIETGAGQVREALVHDGTEFAQVGAGLGGGES